jgi:transketolase
MRPAIRLAALSKYPSIFVFTHDSIGLGEDGPTHQAVEQLASFRAMPGLVVIRPADANETAAAWKVALERRNGPTMLVLTRQKLPVIDQTKYAPAANLEHGAYVLTGDTDPELLLLASGSEVSLALKAYQQLTADGVRARVVSFPSWELFRVQPQEYRDAVLPPTVTARVAIETGVRLGWERFIGDFGEFIGMSSFGASAPADVLLRNFGFTVDAVVQAARRVLA